MKLLPRERYLMIGAAFAAVFFICWTFILNPVMVSNEKTREKISLYSRRIKMYEAIPRKELKNLSRVAKHLDVQPKEEQLNTVISFVQKKMDERKIELMNLRQNASNGKLDVFFSFRTDYVKLMDFFDSFKDLNTSYVLEDISVIRDNRNNAVEVHLVTPYR